MITGRPLGGGPAMPARSDSWLLTYVQNGNLVSSPNLTHPNLVHLAPSQNLEPPSTRMLKRKTWESFIHSSFCALAPLQSITSLAGCIFQMYLKWVPPFLTTLVQAPSPHTWSSVLPPRWLPFPQVASLLSILHTAAPIIF